MPFKHCIEGAVKAFLRRKVLQSASQLSDSEPFIVPVEAERLRSRCEMQDDFVAERFDPNAFTRVLWWIDAEQNRMRTLLPVQQIEPTGAQPAFGDAFPPLSENSTELSRFAEVECTDGHPIEKRPPQV
jgi:hypothetical protein